MTRSNPAADPRVLIVEDEPKMRELLARAIGSWGLRTSSAGSGEEALRLMESEPSQIVILDLNLPAMSGMDCLEQIRQRWRDTQVIILTGFGDLESAKRAIHLDVVEFLTKPARFEELEVALSRAKLRLMDKAPLPELPAEAAEQKPPQPPTPQTPPTTLDEVERQHILATLGKNGGNRSATAAELGISLRTLYYRLNDYQRQGFRID